MQFEQLFILRGFVIMHNLRIMVMTHRVMHYDHVISMLEANMVIMHRVMHYLRLPDPQNPGAGSGYLCITAIKIRFFFLKRYALLFYAIIQNLACTSLVEPVPYAIWPIMHLRGYAFARV